MKICVDSKDLLTIAEQIQYNCEMLSFTDEESAEDDVEFYVPVIRDLAEDLEALAVLKARQATEGGTKRWTNIFRRFWKSWE